MNPEETPVIRKMTESDWKIIQDKSGIDILSMVMQYATKEINATELMDKIATHCELAFEAGIKGLEINHSHLRQVMSEEQVLRILEESGII